MLTPVGTAAARSPDPAAGNAITVTAGHETISQWSGRVGRKLDAGIEYPRPIGAADYDQGIVRVSFQCTDAGVPGNVTLSHGSGSRTIDRAALRAVHRLSGLHPLPEGIATGQKVEAWVVLARDDRSRSQMIASLRHDAEVANAAITQRLSGDRLASTQDPIIVASR
ncbi:TonB family protein [Sphingomonas oryzagri]|uniref:TonB family protein n=1 Tax=Sphingomonas oryzagri TaxID=3042314 RepID=A0ABT6N140_9SPHN|nr:TonB family protein [Sphingomonas oryzagri]MDH7639016.1 TonB family protein [Sphingomonas oryzagri]